MLIPRFWSRAEAEAVTPDGTPVRFQVWRGSRASHAEASALAHDAIGRMADRISRGAGFPEKYAYGDRPLREEVIQEIPGTGADPDAAITRNSYGALVLNAARAFFIDVDVEGSDRPPAAPREPHAAPEPAQSLWGIVDSLPLPGSLRSIVDQFRPASGSPAPPRPAAPAASADPAAEAVERLRRWVATRPGWRVRVYRTYAGLRYLVTHAPFSPTDAETQQVLAAVGADPQYIRLCQVQKSFRARLTPKPWRIGMENPPESFSFADAGAERRTREWEARYDRAGAGHATCRFVEEIGTGAEHPDIAPIRALHDERTRATSGLPLA